MQKFKFLPLLISIVFIATPLNTLSMESKGEKTFSKENKVKDVLNQRLENLEKEQEDLVNDLIASFKCKSIYRENVRSPRHSIQKYPKKIKELETKRKRLARKIDQETQEVSHLLPSLSKNQKDSLDKKIDNLRYLQQKTNEVIDSLKETGGRGGFHSKINSLKKEFARKGRKKITKKVDHEVKNLPSKKKQTVNYNNNPSPRKFYIFRSAKVALYISCVVLAIIFFSKIWAK